MTVHPPNPSEAKNSICLVSCYFGKLPPCIDCFFRSCAHNPTVNWLILTDDQSDYRVPANVKIIKTSLDSLAAKFSDKLGFKVDMRHPIRLCDFRPAFGYLLEDMLGSFAFWGHCDLDMIFGDIRTFISDDILFSHDRILTRGHLSIYRNLSKVNEYFKLEAPNAPGFREVFQTPKSYQFDEWRGIYRILRYHNIPQYHKEVIIDVRPPTRWEITRFEGFQIQNHPWQFFYWYEGRIFQAYPHPEGALMDVEYLYIHFQKRKLPSPAFAPWSEKGFAITPAGFFPYDRRDLTPEEAGNYNSASKRPLKEVTGFYYEALIRRTKRLFVQSSKGKGAPSI